MSDLADLRRRDLIASYLEAYERANGKPCPPIFYRKGWFALPYSDGSTYYRRAAQLQEMRDRLLAAMPTEAGG